MLILPKQKRVQALERVVIDNSWITILLVCLLACIFLLRGLSLERLKGNLTSLTNNSFIEVEIEDNTSFFNTFKNVIFLFSVFVISLFTYKVFVYYVASAKQGFYIYLQVLSFVFVYFVVKRLLEISFSFLFKINKELKFFLVSKSSYLYSISFFLLIAIVLEEYSQLNTYFLVYFAGILFLLRFVLHVFRNKKLIFSKLFYFILYLCAFEIAPLFILFKLLF